MRCRSRIFSLCPDRRMKQRRLPISWLIIVRCLPNVCNRIPTGTRGWISRSSSNNSLPERRVDKRRLVNEASPPSRPGNSRLPPLNGSHAGIIRYVVLICGYNVLSELSSFPVPPKIIVRGAKYYYKKRYLGWFLMRMFIT